MEKDIKIKELDSTNVPYHLRIDPEVIDYEAIDQFKKCLNMDGCIQGFLAPDYHKGYSAPIGSVLKFENRISPELVGYDIGCGMCAVKLGIKPNSLNLNDIKEEIIKKIPLGFDRFENPQKWENFSKMPMTDIAKKAFEEIGQYQLGSLGGGNHFIEMGVDEKDFVWIVIHSGSRGFGHKVASHYMREAAVFNTDKGKYEAEFEEKNKNWIEAIEREKDDAKKEEMRKKYKKAKEAFISRKADANLNIKIEGYYSVPLDSEVGKNYLKDMNACLQFALDNRKKMIQTIINTIDPNVPVLQFINRNHNHAEIVETDKVIHRKGATHAEKGMFGVIPGNMKDGSFIVKGLGNPDSMCSSSHGAGRVLSRSKAKEVLDIDEFNNLMEGIVTNHTKDTIDESPKAYKSIFEVMELQKDLVEVIAHVKPILNIKG